MPVADKFTTLASEKFASSGVKCIPYLSFSSSITVRIVVVFLDGLPWIINSTLSLGRGVSTFVSLPSKSGLPDLMLLLDPSSNFDIVTPHVPDIIKRQFSARSVYPPCAEADHTPP